MNEKQLADVLTPVLASFALELDALEILPAGKRRLLRVVVDGDGAAGTGPNLDEVAEASKALSVALDGSDAVGSAPYTLEVSSRGVSRPLTLPRHWRRNAGRLVAVTLIDGQAVLGRIGAAGDDSVQLQVDGAVQPLAYADVAKAVVQVELNRRSGSESEDE